MIRNKSSSIKCKCYNASMKCVKTTQENNTEITRNKKIKNTGKFGKGNNTDIMLKCCLSVEIIKRNCERFVGSWENFGGNVKFLGIYGG